MTDYNPFSLENKSILVTGASSGIGRSIAIECSKMGASIILTARNKERLEETLALMHNPTKHKIVIADFAKKEDLSHIVSCVTDPLDGIVHCAGFFILKPFQYASEEDMNSIIWVNYEAPAILSQQLIKKKKINKRGSIVFISSISGVWISTMGNSLYSASKGAINGLVKGMAIELASKLIRVNCVNPGMIETNIIKNGEVTQEQLHEDAKRYPLGRYGKPEEVAHAVIYLLSDASSWVTGSNLLIDGGYTLL